MAVKEELMPEIQHWIKSSISCIAEIKDTLNTLKNARALAKRDIHMARASIEIKLKELEAEAELQMTTMVKAEEDSLLRYQKKLIGQKHKIESSEENLKKTCAGLELKRYIEEAKEHLNEIRKSIIASKKHNSPMAVEFNIHDELLRFVNGERSLGTVTIKSNKGTVIRSSADSDALQKGSKEKGRTKPSSENTNSCGLHTKQNGGLVSKWNSAKGRVECSMEIVNKFEKLIQLDVNDVQPFFKMANNVSFDDQSHDTVVTRKGIHKYDHVASKVDTRSSNMHNSVHREPVLNEIKSKQRSMSAYTRDKQDNGIKLDPRISTSAREDSRFLQHQYRHDVKPIMKHLNDTEYVHHEEQGPEQTVKKQKREKLNVRYAKYDTVKEITLLLDENPVEKPYPPDAFVDIFSYSEPRKILSRASGSSITSISSVSYKPSNAHASGPVYVPESETWQSKSYFTYIARFHTKKHPHETDLCRLTGIAALNNGQIVIADINHLKVSLFGPDFTYLSDLECPSPCGVCTVKNDIVAVTLFHNRKILLLKVAMLHIERHKEIHISCPETLYAVKHCETCFYVLCFAGHVHVIDDAGKQVNLIELHTGSGNARNLEVDTKRKLLYISGLENVTCFYQTGDVNWQFTTKTSTRSFNPGGIVQHNDRLFVTDWGNHRVLELSLDGTFVRDVITDNLEFPHAMAVQHSAGRLFITQSNMFRQEARSRSVKVFSVK